MLGLPLRLLAERRHHIGGLPHHVFSRLDELLIQVFLLRLFVFPFAPQLSMQPLSGLSGATQPRTARLLNVLHLILDQYFSPLDQTREDAHAVHEQSTVGGVMNGRLHTGRIQPQLAPLRHLGLSGQGDDAIIERMQRGGVQRVGEAGSGWYHRVLVPRTGDKTSATPGCMDYRPHHLVVRATS